MRPARAAGWAFLLWASPATAQQPLAPGAPAPATPVPAVVETITVVGILPPDADDTPGSVVQIESAALERMNPLTAKETLRRAPGLTVIDEDILGLKLNVSVRGLTARRSGRSLLMEDGAPIQLGPYSDPSAHYYPPMALVEGVEMRRGSGQIPYGPQSIGGTINFVTRPAPAAPMAETTISGGEDGYRLLHLGGGLGGARGGVRLDLLHNESDGIRQGHSSRIDEIAGRGLWRLSRSHTLGAKASYYVEDTRLTESGLTQARYDINPYYNPFEHDRFDLTRSAFQLVHDWRAGARVTVSSQLYRADTFRASYRQTDSSIDPMTPNPATGCTGAARTDYEAFAGRCGNKMRPRRYDFTGAEARLQAGHTLFGAPADFGAGLRVHAEDGRRKRYNGLTPDARESSAGTVLRDDNHIEVMATSGYVLETIRLAAWSITPGLRVERVRTRNDALVANFVEVDRARIVTETTVLPGLGATWSPHSAVTLLAGVHQGYAPPRPDRDIDPNAPFSAVQPERSLETEIGFRARSSRALSLQGTLFDLHLDDLIVEGPLVSGRPGTFVNAGRAVHRGLELSGDCAGGRWGAAWAYTWLFSAEFLSDVELSARGVEGNRVPYAPEHVFDGTLSLTVARGFSAEVGVNVVSAQFADARNTREASADGLAGLIPARTIWRASVNYGPGAWPVRLFVSAQNLTNVAYVSSRVDGLFAGAPRMLTAGLALRLGSGRP